MKRLWQWLFGPRQAFQFSCSCGNGIVARIPGKDKTISLTCACGAIWDLQWTGELFNTRMVNPMAADHAKPALIPGMKIDHNAVDLAAEFRRRWEKGSFGPRFDDESGLVVSQDELFGPHDLG